MTRHARWLELLMPIVVVSFAAWMALSFLRSTDDRQYFFDWELMPATMAACGHGFTQPAVPVEALTAFVARREPQFQCQVLPADLRLATANQMANANRYGLYGPAFAMWLGGASWTTLEYYLAVLFGVSMALTYAFLRISASLPLAVAGTFLLTCSIKLQEILGHRDFIKEPPFLAVLVVLAWMVSRPRTNRQLIGASALGGALIGVGIGCRIDIVVMAPFFGLAIIALAAWEAKPGRWPATAVAAALFLISFGVAATPILRTMSAGSSLGHHVLLGFMTPFTRALNLEPPVYDVGNLYSDGYAYTLIAAQARVRERDLGPLPFGEQPYDRAGARLDLDIVEQFPADTLARSLGAVVEALRYPFSTEAIDAGERMGTAATGGLRAATALRTAIMRRLEGWGVWLTIAAVAIVAMYDLRIAVFALLAILYFCAYSMLQFQRRHTFHLDLFAMAALVFLAQMTVSAIMRVARPASAAPAPTVAPSRRLINSVGLALAFVGVVAAILIPTRWYQQRHVEGVIQASLDAATETVVTETESLAGGEVLFATPGLGQRNEPGPENDLRDVRLDYIVVDLDGPGCRSGAWAARFHYLGEVGNTDKVFNRIVDLPPVAGPEATRLMSPVFYEYGPYALKFLGVAVPADRQHCLRAIRRVPRAGDLPFPFLYASLTQGWAATPLYQRFKWEGN